MIQLLEEHLEKIREDDEDRLEEDDEAAWAGWEVASSESDSDSEGWISVSSDGEEVVISDSEDENPRKKGKTDDELMEVDKEKLPSPELEKPVRMSTLATTKVCPIILV